MGALLQLGFVTANIVRTLSWKTVQKRFPKISKSLFNQIKKYKNKKNLKNAFDKSKPKPKTKPKVDTKPKTQPKKVDPKPTSTKKPTWYNKESAFYAGAWAKIPQKVKDAIMLNYTYTGKNLPPVTRTIVKGGIYSGLFKGGEKVVDAGTKLFQGSGNKKSTDITNEITSGGGTTTGDTKTTTQVAGAGGNVYDRFVAAHNSAMDGGTAQFEFEGKMYTVGPSRLQGI